MNRKLREWLNVMILALSLGWLATGVRADEKGDPTGVWKWTFTRRSGQTVESKLTVKETGDKLSGVYVGARGEEAPVEEINFKDDILSFQVTREREGRKITIDYQGKLSEEAIKGTVKFSFGERTFERDWEAKRVTTESGIAGNWQLSITTDEGQTFEPTLKVTEKAGKLSGMYTGRIGGSTEVQQLKFADSVMSFQVVREFDERKLSLKYRGKLSGEAIRGTVAYELGEDSGTLDFEAKRIKPSAIAGTWKLSIETPEGQMYEPSVKLEEKGGRLTGVYIGVTAEMPIKEAKFENGKLSFLVTREREGQAFSFKYEGKLSGGTLKGTVAYDFNGETGTVDFDGKMADEEE